MSKSNKKDSFLKIFLIVVIIMSLLVTGAIIVIEKTPLKEKIAEKFKIEEILLAEEQHNDTMRASSFNEKQNQTSLQLTEKADNSYFDDILFIGDSRTVGLTNMGFVNNENVLAEVGLSHKDALVTSFEQQYNSYTIEEYLSKNSPRVIIIGFGINGISYMNRDEFMEEYSNLIDKVMEYSPNSKIVIESILPIGEILANKDSRYSNDKVREYNEMIYNMCAQKNIYYMDLFSCLINEDTNYLNEEYDSGDGLHFNKLAYEQLVDYMLTHTI